MDNYETEEQQVEAIKKWWYENFKLIVVLAIVGLGSIVGVQQWNQNQTMKSYTASLEYDHILQVVASGSGDALTHQVQSMQTDYADYPYAALASLLEARELIDAGKSAEAEKKFQWVIDNSKTTTLQHISRIRLATLMSAQGKNEQALKILDVEQGSFKASYMEIKGDILVSLNRINEAKAAYDQALQAYEGMGANAQILKIKRNDLGNS
jgi:predicted negative regulator of RcsB-dependent stress response